MSYVNYIKKLIVKSLEQFFRHVFNKILFSYRKMSKDSSANYYQRTKKESKKKLVKDIKIFLKKRKAKSGNMVVNDIKIFLKMKNKGQLSKTNNYGIRKNKTASQIKLILINTFISLLKTFLNFANIKNSGAAFKTHLKKSVLTFLLTYKKFVFQRSIGIILFRKFSFPLIIKNLFFVWKIVFLR